MRKIKFSEIKKIFNNIKVNDIPSTKAIDVYHSNEWDHYDKNRTHDNARRYFYRDLNVMINFLNHFLKCLEINAIILSPLYNYHFFENYRRISDIDKDIYDELKKIAKDNNLNTNDRNGLIIDLFNNKNILEAVCEGGFRGISHFCICIPEKKLIIEPHHHMNFLFYCLDNSINQDYIKSIVLKFDELKCC